VDPFDPQQNVDGGVRHLRDLLRVFAGDVRLALAAYNAGAGSVRAYRGVPAYRETQQYVRLVTARYRLLPATPPDEPILALPAPAETPQVIYTQTLADGTVLYTNVPPDPDRVLERLSKPM
jgi:Transglycosylase SLT domain